MSTGNLNRHKKEKHNISLGTEATTEEEAAHILNEMSAARRATQENSADGPDNNMEDSMDGEAIYLCLCRAVF